MRRAANVSVVVEDMFVEIAILGFSSGFVLKKYLIREKVFYKIDPQICGLLGATLLGVCLTQDLCVLPIALLVVVCLGLIRFLSLKLIPYKAKGEMPIKKWVLNMRQLLSALTETVWAMLVSYTVGTSLSPIVHKSPLVGGFFIVSVVGQKGAPVSPFSRRIR